MSLQVWLPLTGDLRQQGLSNAEATVGTTIAHTWENVGKIGNNSSKGHVIVNDPNLIDTFNSTHFSICFWCNIAETTTAGSVAETYVISCGTSGTRTNLHIPIRVNGGAMAFCFYSDDYTFLNSVSDRIGTWMHVACIYNDRQQIVYINGEKIGERTANGDLNIAANQPLHIYSAHTLLNDLRIYDHALTESEVKEISRGLVLHYPLNDRYVEPTANIITSLRAGGRTVVVDGDKIQNTGENVDTYFYLMNPGLVAGETYTISYYCQGLSESDPSWQFGVGAQSATHANHCGYIPIKNGWNELTFVCPEGLNGNTQLILDDYSATWRTTVVTFSNFQLEHNDHKTATQPLNTWYGAELTANTMINSSGAISSTSNWYTTDLIQITPGKSYTLTGLSKGGSGTYVALYNKSKTLSRVLLITANQDVTITASSSEYFFRTSIRNIAYELTTTAKLLYADEVIHDIGGFKNNGVITNSLTMSNDTVRYKVAAYFNGSSYITADYLPAETKTISLWVKIDTMPSTNSVLFADNKDDVASGLALGFFQGTYFITGTVSANYAVLNGTINIGEWNHICVVKTGTNNRNVYVNNTLLSNVGSNSWSHNSSKLWIGGRSYSSGAYFTGLMSDFRVYTTALSADDIKELYEMGVSV